MPMNKYQVIRTKIGKLTLLAKETALIGLFFGEYRVDRALNESNEVLSLTAQQLEEYFSGERRSFDIPLEAKGTKFQEKVWQALITIPYGETRAYSEIAAQIGNPKACRAVGLANNRNPIAIIIPCHRVIGKNGKLVGYGGGLEIKETLLSLENCS